MSIPDAEIFEAYVPVYDAVPENWEDARAFLTEQLKMITNAVNIREIGFFLDEELLSGKQFIPSSTFATTQGVNLQYRSVFRKVIDFGPLPASGTKSVPHGITVDDNFTLIQLYGAATQPSSFGIPLPFVEVLIPANGGIQLYMDATNVSVVVGSDRSVFTRCFITIEYLLEL